MHQQYETAHNSGGNLGLVEKGGPTNLTILVACANIPDTLQFVKSNETKCNQRAGIPTFVIRKQALFNLSTSQFVIVCQTYVELEVKNARSYHVNNQRLGGWQSKQTTHMSPSLLDNQRVGNATVWYANMSCYGLGSMR